VRHLGPIAIDHVRPLHRSLDGARLRLDGGSDRVRIQEIDDPHAQGSEHGCIPEEAGQDGGELISQTM